MRLNCKGFMLPDYLLAFTIWLLIALTWMPVYIHVLKQLEDSAQSKFVHELFYQYLMEVKLGEAEKGISSIEKKEQTYPIFWEEDNKVCIQYENVFQQSKKICDVWTE
ncbi:MULTISPECIES: hypothetical protein [Bacillaceae]|uniref:Uncharacterized protein n=2 Tax=Niallia TaxID=2837506 RepID=A0A941G9L1_NIACI|nr:MULTISPECIES: hypothetical protein [Bacillaceae]EOR21675.1 hypothetical protein A499_21935 [Niallia nealsonii AAU1]MCB5235836.1 hypothetical protein [Niallia circulans]MDU1845277.1 hypothetical protein [Niallia nealsonii]MED3791273.1 hypothetical protein [Niallia alba]